MGKQRFLVLDTIGLEQRTKDGTRCPYRQEEFWPVIQGTSVPSRVPCWDIGGLPFDSAQVEFVRNEIATLGAEIEHVFIFMHHTHPWAEHDGWWWDRLHPILKGSPTRAVFSGDPYNGKYGYVLQDEIKYVQSAIFGGVKPGFFASKRNIKHVWHTYHQLDNFQHVVIEGSDPENVKIETIVVGALTSDAGSWRYWDEVSEAYTWSQRLPEQFYKHFHRLKALLLLALSYGAACLVLGMGVVLFWMRWKRNRQMN